MRIRDRIKELRRVRASELLPNPKNWRTHPDAQADALKGVLAEIGFANAVLARETDQGLMLLDGHLRAEVAPEAIIPVLVVDVTQAEADKLLATLDPLAAMAEADKETLADLLDGIETNSDALAKMLEGMRLEHGLDLDEGQEFDESVEDDVEMIECPHCGQLFPK